MVTLSYDSSCTVSPCDSVWGGWTTGSEYSTTTGTGVWSTWTITTNSSTSTSNTVWINWMSAGNIHVSDGIVRIDNGVFDGGGDITAPANPGYTVSIWNDWVTIYNETEEQKQARLQREEELRHQAEERRHVVERQRAKALVTAEELLTELIGEEEMAVFRRAGRLLIKGRTHDYLLHRTGAVQRLEKDKVVDLCVHLQNKGAFVDIDNVIALKCAIESDEDSFNREARSQGSRPRPAELPLAANG